MTSKGAVTRLSPIDPHAPFDAAAWINAAEARGYRLTVTPRGDACAGRTLGRDEPETVASDDTALWQWLAGATPDDRARNRADVLDHLSRRES